ncbi:MAG: CcmD family protein [Acidobacteria bacterium]|nr:CcmD family protein [Acidobacteriota bacterium]
MHTQRSSFTRSILRAVVLTAIVVVPLAAPLGASEVSGVPAVVALQQVEPGPRSDGFEPVGQVPAQEQMPAAPMVMAAYGVVWVLTVAFVVSVWRRIGKVEQELREVEQRVAQEARRK